MIDPAVLGALAALAAALVLLFHCYDEGEDE